MLNFCLYVNELRLYMFINFMSIKKSVTSVSKTFTCTSMSKIVTVLFCLFLLGHKI